MPTKTGKYQIYWLSEWAIGFRKYERNTMQYVLSWSIWLGKIGVHKYITEKKRKELFKRDNIK